jgi:glycopeptide antibiotics resistance protein
LRKIAAALLVAHLLLLFYLTLGIYTTPRLAPNVRLNLTPLRTINWYLHAGGIEFLVNIVGNLGVFAPIGILWPVIRNGRTTIWRIAFLSAGLSLLVETLQFFSGFRFADVDDVLLNTLGGVMGYAAFVAGRHALSAARKMTAVDDGQRTPTASSVALSGPHRPLSKGDISVGTSQGDVGTSD